MFCCDEISVISQFGTFVFRILFLILFTFCSFLQTPKRPRVESSSGDEEEEKEEETAETPPRPAEAIALMKTPSRNPVARNRSGYASKSAEKRPSTPPVAQQASASASKAILPPGETPKKALERTIKRWKRTRLRSQRKESKKLLDFSEDDQEGKRPARQEKHRMRRPSDSSSVSAASAFTHQSAVAVSQVVISE
jgi:hypothetical protein